VKPAQPASTPARRLLAPVAGVTAILLGCKLAGFSEKIVVAHYLGTSRDADAYYAAFAVVWMVVFILRELLQPAFMPVYVRSLGAPAPLSGRLITGVLAVLVPLIIGSTVVLALWPAALIRLAAPGFDPNVQRQTGELLRAMSLGTAGLTLMGLTHVILNAHARFCWAAAGDLLFRIAFVGSLIGGFVILGGNHAGSALAAGAVGGLVLHIVVVRRHARPARPCLDRSTRNGLAEMLALAAPQVVGVFCSHLGQMVDGVLASMLAPGRLSALAYARKLTDAMVLLGPVALGTVLFSHFSSLAAAGRVEEMRSLLVRCARVVLAVSLLISVLVVIL
jgi:peptidoglycan biosynthesis protein MviN/MurJ (putative lipid II flippase)